MLKVVERTPIFEAESSPRFPSTPRKAIKISSQKLPPDFFSGNRVSCYTSVLISRVSRNVPERAKAEVNTSHFRRNSMRSGGVNGQTFSPEGCEENLILGLISSARNMHKVFRKQSAQLQRDTDYIRNVQNVELPRLKLRTRGTNNY